MRLRILGARNSGASPGLRNVAGKCRRDSLLDAQKRVPTTQDDFLGTGPILFNCDTGKCRRDSQKAVHLNRMVRITDIPRPDPPLP